jgi:hypothetical protein
METATRRPDHCPEPGQHLCLHRQREAPPKARWLNPPLPRANKPRPEACNSATLRLARRMPGQWPAKGATAGVDSSAPLPIKKRPYRRENEGGMKSVPRNSPRVQAPGGRRTSRWAPLLADTWTQSKLMRSTLYFGYLESTCADKGLTEVTHG